MRRVTFYRRAREAVKNRFIALSVPSRSAPCRTSAVTGWLPDHSERIARPNHRTPHVGNRGIVKPETFLRLPEVPADHVFKIGDVDLGARIEGIGIIHRDKPACHVPFVPTCLLVGFAKVVGGLIVLAK